MPEFAPTISQKQAIEERGRSILVSAGAGSGKTKVLTERLMGRLLDAQDPADISRFVVITFTQAAAAELRGRITDELAKAAAAAEKNGAPQEMRDHIRRQQALCGTAQIGTIHHFCSSILRENGHLAGIASDFRIVSDERAEGMKTDALNRTLDDRYQKMAEYPGFESLVNSAGIGKDDSQLAELILQLHNKMQCHPRPKVWAENCVAALNQEYADVGTTPWGKVILSDCISIVHYWAQELDRVMAALAADEVVKKAYLDGFAQGADSVRELERCLKLGWERTRECPPVAFGKLGRVKSDYNPDLTEWAKKRKAACIAAMKKVMSFFYADSALLSEEMQRTTPAMEALLQVTLDFDRRYAADKRRAGVADYSDLEHMTAEILTDPETRKPTPLARSIASRYEEIMIDEYQDVSRVQEAIFEAVSREGKNLFMVGDVKQAIYRFRLADPEIFNEKYRDYAPCDEAGPGEPCKILLRENFRSRREILDGANSVFRRCMTHDVGDIDYDDDAALVYGATGYEGSVPTPEIRLFEIPEAEEGRSAPDKVRLEAENVAAMIENLVSSGTEVRSGDGTRPMEYGDIAILLRSANTIGGVYRRALLDRGIPVVSGQGGGLFETKEVSFVTSMLRILDNPRSDIPLIAVLSSPVFGFTADELAEIRIAARKACFYEACRIYAGSNPKMQEFLTLLDSFRERVPDLTAEKTVRMILTETDVMAICSAMPDGAGRTSNLLQMLGIAEKYEQEGTYGLHGFVKYLDRLEKKNNAIPASSGASPSVQIVSIHRSKGLEYPVVFLCDTGKRFNFQDASDAVLVHPELGLGPKMVDNERFVQIPTLARRAIARRMRKETLSEEMRLMYVALTRAKERLFITAAVKDPEEFVEKRRILLPEDGTGVIDPEVAAEAITPIEWFVLAALADGQEHIRLIRETPEEAEAARNEENTGDAEAKADPDLLEQLASNLSFVYPYSEAEELPSKITATEVKHYEKQEDPEAADLVPAEKREKRSFRMPDFPESRPLTGAERGIATHLALQYMDLSKAGSPEGVREEIERLQQAAFLSSRQAEAVSQEAITELFRSEIGQRIRTADKVHREFRFSLLCRAGEILPVSSDEEILLQGVVDCCLEENGELVIIDYKTDSVRTPEQIRQRRDLYAGQVRAYATALSRIFGMPVKQTVLYFLSCGETVTV